MLCRKITYEWFIRGIKMKKSQVIGVYTGHEHGLILTDDGTLYGIGKVPKFGTFSDMTYLCDSVCSVAAGRDYDILLLKNGSILIQGDGELDGTTLSIPNALMVYASYSHNAFWIQDKEGALFVFGENRVALKETLHSHEYKELYDSSKMEQAVIVHTGVTDFYGKGKKKPINLQSFFFSISKQTQGKYPEEELQQYVRSEKPFLDAVKTYGEKNVFMGACPNSMMRYVTGIDSYEDRFEYILTLFYHNNFIYEPIPSDITYLPKEYLLGSGLIKISDVILENIPKSENLKKAMKLFPSLYVSSSSFDPNTMVATKGSGEEFDKRWLLLDTTGEVSYFDYAISQNVCNRISNIADISASTDIVLMLTKDNQLLCGSTKELMKGNFPNQQLLIGK